MGYIGKEGNDKVGKEGSKDNSKDGSTDNVFSDSYCQLTEINVLENLDVIKSLDLDSDPNLSPLSLHNPIRVFSF